MCAGIVESLSSVRYQLPAYQAGCSPHYTFTGWFSLLVSCPNVKHTELTDFMFSRSHEMLSTDICSAHSSFKNNYPFSRKSNLQGLIGGATSAQKEKLDMSQFYSSHDFICHSFHLYHVTFSKLQENKEFNSNTILHQHSFSTEFEILRCHSSST